MTKRLVVLRWVLGHALLASALFFSTSASAQEVSLRRGGEPAHLPAGHAIIVNGVQYVGRSSGKCRLWISDEGDFRSSGCDLRPDERPLSERVVDTWEERPSVVVGVSIALLLCVVGIVALIARRNARRALEQPGAPAPT